MSNQGPDDNTGATFEQNIDALFEDAPTPTLTESPPDDNSDSKGDDVAP